ncbi:glycosyltransferase family 4 protein [Bradyrhizobium sp.]|uniref:glycosyltransferase family 4 protein n=1 Tax=Bradyrhizobium sp. TaxID=376 RepID=UPI002B8E28EF|nr:glycosyltransferase family 4 protein [Bradyrhizobium sp.]HWX59270.1 glycosyltransferase family 4 protein [Bradyrhizobium sp.]
MKFLIYCTEWESGHGGLSTFNREFCLALAQLGHEVYLRIVTGGTIESQSNMLFRLEHSGSWRPQPYTGRLGMINPDVIVGHDRVSGKAMLHEAQQFMMSAKRFLFIHTDPRIEAYGDSDDRFAGTNLNRKLTLQDDLLRQTGWAIAVGPRLYRHVLERVSGFAPGPAVFRLDPGFCSRDEMRQVAHTADFRLLLIARPNDVELKGREIAIDAALLAKKGLTTQSTLLPSAERIHLGICGVSEPEMAKLARRLGNEGRISSYVVERGKIAEEFRRAHLVLMPSYEEGFGLVALEALEANRPVLATSNSGFAEFLREQFAETELGKFVEAMIVNEPSRIANAYSNSRSSTWADRIVESIQSYDSLADGVERIRAALSKKTWEHRVKQLLAQSF